MVGAGRELGGLTVFQLGREPRPEPGMVVQKGKAMDIGEENERQK